MQPKFDTGAAELIFGGPHFGHPCYSPTGRRSVIEKLFYVEMCLELLVD